MPKTTQDLKNLAMNCCKDTLDPDTIFTLFLLSKKGEETELSQTCDKSDLIGQFLSELGDEEQIDIKIKLADKSEQNLNNHPKTTTSANLLKENPLINLKTGQSGWKNIYSKDQNTFHLKNDNNIPKEEDFRQDQKKGELIVENEFFKLKKLKNSLKSPSQSYQKPNKPSNYSLDKCIEKDINDQLDEPELNTDIDKLYYDNDIRKSIPNDGLHPNQLQSNSQNQSIEEPKGFLEYLYPGDYEGGCDNKSKNRSELERHVGTMNQKAREQMNLINRFVMDNTSQNNSIDSTANSEKKLQKHENLIPNNSVFEPNLPKESEPKLQEFQKKNKELSEKIVYLETINKDYCNDIAGLTSKLEVLNISQNSNQNIDSGLEAQLQQKNTEIAQFKTEVRLLKKKSETCDAIDNSYKLKQKEVTKQKSEIKQLCNELADEKKVINNIDINQNGKNIIYELAKTIEVYRNRLAGAMASTSDNQTDITIEQEKTISNLITEMQDYSLLLVNTQYALENKDTECQKSMIEINKFKQMESQFRNLNGMMMQAGAKFELAEKSNKEKDTYIAFMQEQNQAQSERLEEYILIESTNDEKLLEYEVLKDQFEIKNQEIVSLKGIIKDTETKEVELESRLREAQNESENLKENNIGNMIEIEAMKVANQKNISQSSGFQKNESFDVDSVDAQKTTEESDFKHEQNRLLRDQVAQLQKQILDLNLQNMTKVDSEQMAMEDDEECSIFDKTASKNPDMEASVKILQNDNKRLLVQNDEYMLKLAESESINESLKQSLNETGIAFDNSQQEADNKLSQQLMEFMEKENNVRNEYDGEILKLKNFIQMLTTKLGSNQIVMNPTYNNELNMNGNFNQLGMPIQNQYQNEPM